MIGTFIKFDRWTEAVNLLKFQISSRRNDRHFNSLSMFFYERCIHLKDIIDTEEYFNSRISNDIFYILENEFFATDYLKPKKGLEIRRYKFLSYSMRVIYYTMGLYIAEITQDLLKDLKDLNSNIYSFYGGDIKYQNNKLVLKSETVTYRKHYKKFRKMMRNEINNSDDNTIVIRLDIKDFFDEIDIYILLDKLDKCLKSNIKLKYNFNSLTIKEMAKFFNFIINKGIPQCDNDVISSCIGNLYLKFADIYIAEEIEKTKDLVESFKIIRYVDDIYICINKKTGIDTRIEEKLINNLTERIIDKIYGELNLRFNNKSKLFMMNEKTHRDSLMRNLKRISSQYYDNDDENKTSPQDKFNEIQDLLTELKYSIYDIAFRNDYDMFEETIKEVFDKNLENLMRKPENKSLINELFLDFDFDLVKMSSMEIIIIMEKDLETIKRFRQSLIDKSSMTTMDIEMIISLLCQHEFNDNELINKLKYNDYMKNIIQWYQNPEKCYLGYYNLDEAQIKNISKKDIIEQAILRTINEKDKNFNVALNHLLNEIHAICKKIDPNFSKDKDYNATNVGVFLKSRNIDFDIIIKIKNLFDRRNTNNISHPSSDSINNQPVEHNEYIEYKDYVEKCLKLLL